MRAISSIVDANDIEDPTRVPGYTPDMAQEFGLADIVRSNVYPSVSGESGITNKLEREIYPILRAAKNAPQLSDRLVSLIKSEALMIIFMPLSSLLKMDQLWLIANFYGYPVQLFHFLIVYAHWLDNCYLYNSLSNVEFVFYM